MIITQHPISHCGIQNQHRNLSACNNGGHRIPAFAGATKTRGFHTRSDRYLLVTAQAVDYRIAAPPVRFDDSGTADEVRSYLTKLGWERAWIDGITERIIKCEFKTSLSQVQEVVQLLEGLGLQTHQVCNMMSRAPAVLGRDPQQQIKRVLDYIQGRGVQGEAFLRLLRDYPRLLTFDVSSSGSTLELGPARAEVDVIEDAHRGRIANVSYWRDGAAFETAPVSPRKPGTD